MSIPPHRTAGESGHIEDHNAIADVLMGHDADIADLDINLAAHRSADDPHGDRAYTDQAIEDTLADIADPPVTSVNGKTGNVDLVADDVGAATPSGVESLVNQLESDVDGKLANKVDSSSVGEPNGVAPLNSSGLVSSDYIPSLTGSNKVIVSEDNPDHPEDGDIWINLSDPSFEPSPLMPSVYKTVYEGSESPPYSSIQPVGQWVPVHSMAPIVFTTGPTGYTEITVRFNLVNNATDGSTTHVSYTISGEGVSYASGWRRGAYQSPRGFNTAVGIDIFSSQDLSLPPNTEVTLSPTWRLSSLPSQSNQNGGTGRRFIVGEDPENFIRVKAW